MKLKFSYLLILSASILVGIAAFFSVTGFSELFAGAKYSIIVMISGLEIAKLTVTSFLYRYWTTINKGMKTYFLIAISILMIITSAGIYGFLSSAYASTSDKIGNLEGQVDLLNQKKEIIKSNVDRINSSIENKNKRLNSLTTLRTSQESRIDTLYKKGMINGVKRTEQIIKDANIEITKTGKEIDSLNKQTQIALDSSGRIDSKILDLKNNNVKGEISPLQYIAKLTGKSIDSIVNFFILLLIFVCDPLAVCLVIATNKVLLEDSKKKSLKE